jgi:hypothetical protein
VVLLPLAVVTTALLPLYSRWSRSRRAVSAFDVAVGSHDGSGSVALESER